MKQLREFMRGVKEGEIRGNFVQTRIDEDTVVELSVGPFEYGHIHLRLLIDDDRINAEQEMYYRQLYTIDEKYRTLHQNLQSVIEDENEAAVANAHTWEAANHDKVENYPDLPDGFTVESTVFFEDFVQLRDDVTIEEAILTNRTNK